jgi:hypothetical protein
MSALATELVELVLTFDEDDEDIAVNGYDARNRARLAEAIENALRSRAKGWLAAWCKPASEATTTEGERSFDEELQTLQSACEYSSEPTTTGRHPITGVRVNDSVDALIDYKNALEELLGTRWAHASAWERLERAVNPGGSAGLHGGELAGRAVARPPAVDIAENAEAGEPPAPAAPKLDAYELRSDAERVIGEDRVPRDVLENLLTEYGD